jgi:hypothetical protein
MQTPTNATAGRLRIDVDVGGGASDAGQIARETAEMAQNAGVAFELGE